MTIDGIRSREDFDVWYLRKIDKILFATSSIDVSSLTSISLFENGLFQGGHPFRIFVSKAELDEEFEELMFVEKFFAGCTQRVMVPRTNILEQIV